MLRASAEGANEWGIGPTTKAAAAADKAKSRMGIILPPSKPSDPLNHRAAAVNGR